jgi:hypothetical protein
MSMDPNAQKEQFSCAYVQAVAAVAGYAWSKPSVDDDSIDFTLSSRGGRGTVRSPKLDLQVKCHAQAPPSEPTFSFPLKIKNYDDLRDASVMVPRLLVVVVVPHDLTDWLSQSDSELTLRHCGYWISLRGRPETTNRTTVTIPIERSNQFTADGLSTIMQRVASGGLP